jgi:hypothetical protein
VVDLLADIPMEDRDTKGDLYEYMLSKIASAGQNGQFRTPRHIIALMVEMMAPGPKDVICDPAAGTCGFLVAAGEYLRDNHPEIFRDEALRRHFHDGMFHGFDFDGTMLRIGSMNMLLHGIENPDVRYKDSLAKNGGDADRYSLVLANPPFAGSLDYETTAKDLLKIVKTKKTELLFVALFLKLLKPGGRAAVIVPDGVLFGSSTAHKAIRRMLVEDHRLDGIVKLPSGVFRPYAGVSTAILLFTKTNSGGTDHVWFYDCQADGLSLDDKRTPLLPDEKQGPTPDEKKASSLSDEEHARNNLPDIAARWPERTGTEHKRARTDQSFCVPKDEIVRCRLRPVDQPLQGGRARAAGAPSAEGDHRRVEGAGEGDRRRAGRAGGDAVKGLAQPFIRPSDVRSHRVFFPPLDEQRRIAAILEKADALRRKRKRSLELLQGHTRSIFMKMFGSLTENDRQLPTVGISDTCQLIVDCVNRTAPTVENPTAYKMIRTTNVRRGSVDLHSVRFVTKDTFDRWNRRATPRIGDVLLTREAPVGEAGILLSNDRVFLGQRLMLYRVDEAVATPEFLCHSFQDDFLKRQFDQMGSGSTVKHLPLPACRAFQLRLPPLSEQQDFSARVRSTWKLLATLETQAAELNGAFCFSPIPRLRWSAVSPRHVQHRIPYYRFPYRPRCVAEFPCHMVT